MLEPLGKSLGAVVEERLSSPLVSSFAISWSLINYKFFVILLSKNSVTETFALIEKLCFPTMWHWIGYGIVLPSVATYLYIYWLPSISLRVYERWRLTQHENDRIRNKYPTDKMLSQEESWEYQKKFAELQQAVASEQMTFKAVQGDLDLANNKIKGLTESAANGLNETRELQAKFHAIVSELKESELNNAGLRGTLRQGKLTLSKLRTVIEKNGNVDEDFWSNDDKEFFAKILRVEDAELVGVHPDGSITRS
ncbi:hypothetical protein [Hydrogenophaga laconesensis]|uniref:Coiled-coil protein SlyX n=1 Tax=Hydrogenophaga laconesensis TaxID=1805971 RepID=A0ABU1VHV5_9BURK|nr:hypothetical protein [Hydrogenophaga laconesensis]MDR7097064.1 putative coiled-coil protein SlyX [Hydrogenophaga laconesensis]